MTTALAQRENSALSAMATRLSVDPVELKTTLVNTVFKKASDEQMTALCIVANEYGLNPFVKEIYAFPSQSGIVPMVSIDGWLRIINSHPQMAGMDIVYADEIVQVGKSRHCPEYVEVTIHRKDRPGAHTPIREYLEECYRNTDPWNNMTRRMLRHKAIMQAGRVAFGLSGIYDQDEANDILASESKRIVAAGDGYEVIDAEATEDAVERLGPDAWEALIEAAAALDFTADDVLANAAALGWEGPGDEMPRDVAKQIYRGLKQTANERPGDDDSPPTGPARPEQIAEIDELRAKSSLYEAEVMSVIDEYGDVSADRYGLTEESAVWVIEALKERAS